MIEIVIALIVLGTIAMERCKRCNGFIIYTVPIEKMKTFLERVSYSVPWNLVGDFGIVLLVGPILGRELVKDKRIYIMYAIAGLAIVHSITQAVAYLLLGTMGMGVIMILEYGAKIVIEYMTGIKPLPGVGLLIPGVKMGPFEIPLVEGIIALLIALVVHEGAHGCVAIRNRIPVLTSGLITIGALPIGAYVEPSEIVLSKRSRKERARVFAAGPAANIITFVCASLVLMLTANIANAIACEVGGGVKVLSVPEKIEIQGTEIPSMAFGRIKEGDIIREVNGNEVKCYQEFLAVMQKYRENEYNGTVSFKIERNGSIYSIKMPLYKGFMGIKGVEQVSKNLLLPPMFFIVSVFQWIALINLIVGIVNSLPLPLLDGGLLSREFADTERRKALFRCLSYITIFALFLNILPWFI